MNIRIQRIDLSELDYERLVERLDGRTVYMASGSRRCDRQALPNQTVVILELAYDNDQPPLRYEVRVRNISAMGMAFFHAAELTPKQPCTLLIITPDRSGWRVRANVVRCRDVGDGICEIGVTFDQAVELDDLRAGGNAQPADQDGQSA